MASGHQKGLLYFLYCPSSTAAFEVNYYPRVD